ncbi:unnamed protein product [Clavelina lepadiformis]|uniref:Uncharacterized protein n=1 Tax=Clavelina lepadiformis TaxID=159417 RepID=A0ABP0GSY5_CLALP
MPSLTVMTEVSELFDVMLASFFDVIGALGEDVNTSLQMSEEKATSDRSLEVTRCVCLSLKITGCTLSSGVDVSIAVIEVIGSSDPKENPCEGIVWE